MIKDRCSFTDREVGVKLMVGLISFDFLCSRFVVVHLILSLGVCLSPSSGKSLRLPFSLFVDDRVPYDP